MQTKKTLKSEYPLIAKEWHPTKNGMLLPSDVAPFSNKNVWWKCPTCGGEWESRVATRSRGAGCPYCSGRYVLTGFNDLQTLNPKLAAEWHPTRNKDLHPTDVTAHSNKKVWWLCPVCGHEWEATIEHRSYGRGCPKCGRRTTAQKLTKKNLIEGVNDLKTLFPEIAAEWDHDKNNDLPSDYSPFSMRKKWWICSRGHSFEQAIASRTSQKQGCPYCASTKVLAGFNDLETLYPEIAAQWDYEKNDRKPSEVLSKSNYKAYWICRNGHSYRTAVSERTTSKNMDYCPYCSGKKVLKGFNDLATVRPELAAQWDYELNGELKPTDVAEFSMKKAWWRCDKGHSWSATIAGRSSGNNCPYCSNVALLKGFNDVATLFPEVAKEWSEDNEKGPDEYIAGSHARVKWKCSRCGYEWRTVIKERTYSGTGCPRCTHYFKTSAPEQTVYYYVKQAFPDAINSYRDKDIQNAEIDIFIPSIKLGIEYDGGFWHGDETRDLEKTAILKKNGIALVRIREENAAPITDGSIQIVTKETSDDLTKLRPAVDALFDIIESQFKSNVRPDINIDRDYVSILALSEGNRYHKSLAATNSVILSEWDYEHNGTLSPEMFTAHSRKQVYWKCSKCGKVWKQAIATKLKGGLYCETCNKRRANRTKIQKALKEGKAIPLTNYPLLVAEWFDDSDINEYSHGSMKQARWKCSVCGNIFYQIIKNRTTQGQGCPICGNKRKGIANKREVKNLDTGEVFTSIREAAAAYNVSDSAIWKCVNREVQTCKGYHWAFSKDGKIDPSDELMDQLFFDE